MNNFFKFYMIDKSLKNRWCGSQLYKKTNVCELCNAAKLLTEFVRRLWVAEFPSN